MIRLWLPPIEICCSQVKIEFVLAENFESHLHLSCPLHGNKFIPNPLSISKYKIKIRPSGKLKKLMLSNMSKREKHLKRFLIKDNKRQTSLKLSGKTATLF